MATPSATPPACAADCDGDDSVTVDEVVTLISIALGVAEISTCPPGDLSGDGDVTVDEIVAGVNNALDGCAAIGGDEV